jgi:hypothetical protein
LDVEHHHIGPAFTDERESGRSAVRLAHKNRPCIISFDDTPHQSAAFVSGVHENDSTGGCPRKIFNDHQAT